MRYSGSRAAIAVLVCPGLIGRLEVPDAIAVLDGSAALALALVESAVPVWWWELVWLVERLVGLARDESRLAASRAGWLENQV
jgi:hypothetical protein